MDKMLQEFKDKISGLSSDNLIMQYKAYYYLENLYTDIPSFDWNIFIQHLEIIKQELQNREVQNNFINESTKELYIKFYESKELYEVIQQLQFMVELSIKALDRFVLSNKQEDLDNYNYYKTFISILSKIISNKSDDYLKQFDKNINAKIIEELVILKQTLTKIKNYPIKTEFISYIDNLLTLVQEQIKNRISELCKNQ